MQERHSSVGFSERTSLRMVLRFSSSSSSLVVTFMSACRAWAQDATGSRRPSTFTTHRRQLAEGSTRES